jgi:hypothetical protein
LSRRVASYTIRDGIGIDRYPERELYAVEACEKSEGREGECRRDRGLKQELSQGHDDVHAFDDRKVEEFRKLGP